MSVKFQAQLSQAQVAHSDATALHDHAIDLQHRLDYLRTAMPLDGDLYQEATHAYDAAVNAVNTAWSALRAVETLMARLEQGQ